MNPMTERIAAAPISWGVSEVPGWGHQMKPGRVFAEMRSLGLQASELGPNGYFACDPRVIQGMRSSDFSIMAGFVPITLRFPGGMIDSAESLNETFSRLKEAGAKYVVLAVAGPTTDYQSRLSLKDDDWSLVTEALKIVEEVAGANGLQAVLHPHFGTFVETARDGLKAIEGSDIGICLDTGHLALAGDDPIDLVSLAPDKVLHVHLKDLDAALAAQVRQGAVSYQDAIKQGLYRPLGQGDIDIENIITRLELAGYEGWYVLEQDVAISQEPSPGEGPVLDVIESLKFLTSLQRKIGTAKISAEKSDVSLGR